MDDFETLRNDINLLQNQINDIHRALRIIIQLSPHIDTTVERFLVEVMGEIDD